MGIEPTVVDDDDDDDKCQINFDFIEKWRIIDFLTWPPTNFSALKNVQATTPVQ